MLERSPSSAVAARLARLDELRYPADLARIGDLGRGLVGHPPHASIGGPAGARVVTHRLARLTSSARVLALAGASLVLVDPRDLAIQASQRRRDDLLLDQRSAVAPAGRRVVVPDDRAMARRKIRRARLSQT